MHSDLSPHLHTPECNRLIDLLKNCHTEHKYAKFVGFCNDFNDQVLDCLRNERKEHSRKNREQAQEKQRLVQERMRQLRKEGDSGNTV
ncbi:COX assembly mitochondrial protein 2 homolog [Armigeres subalbatus]|uniref:COX assembly mitochondrial protein 2 homolog n=1 Tax=Armigeres subalbatus TaxID=124917 RepID=UPI002ED1F6F0